MKFYPMHNEWFQLSIPNTSIILERPQLFFLESFLKKNVSDLKIIKGFELINGKVQFEICTGKKVSNMSDVMKKVIDYLLIFQPMDSKIPHNKRIVKIKRTDQMRQGSRLGAISNVHL